MARVGFKCTRIKKLPNKMCAIIGQAGGPLDKEKFVQARDLMITRGPDDSGSYYDEKNAVALGHRRLSIIDLSSAGKQPMFSHEGRYVIVFNGEIFNFIELRAELSNYPFKTKTDTEVLLAAYFKWGKDCLGKLNGQFAFTIYDTKNRKFLFASEIKSILALGIKARPNDKIIFEYLRQSFYDHSEDTFFVGIKKLMPGEYVVWKDGVFSKG